MLIKPQSTPVNIDLNAPVEVDEDHQTAPQEPSQMNPPNQNKMAPYLRNVKRKVPPQKAKSAPNPSSRKSMRLRSVVGTKKTNSVDKTVYEIPDSDGEPEQNTPLAEKTSSHLKPKPKSNKKVSKPAVKVCVPKPKPKPAEKDKGKQKETAWSEQSPKGSPNKDKELSLDYSLERFPKHKTASKPKNINISQGNKMPLFGPTLKKEFKEKWGSRSIAVGRYFDFVNWESEKIVLKEYVEEQGVTKFLEIPERHYPKLIQAFYMAEAFPEESLIVSRVKDVEIRLTPQVISDILGISNKGKTVFGDNWFKKLGVDPTHVYKILFKPNVSEFVSSNLLPTPKMLNGISQRSVIPRNGFNLSIQMIF